VKDRTVSLRSGETKIEVLKSSVASITTEQAGTGES